MGPLLRNPVIDRDLHINLTHMSQHINYSVLVYAIREIKLDNIYISIVGIIIVIS